MGKLYYTWDFGDGTPKVTTTSDYLRDLHVYKDAGVYTVTLTVQDEYGGYGVAKKQIEILTRIDSFFFKIEANGTYLHTDIDDVYKDLLNNPPHWIKSPGTLECGRFLSSRKA